MKTMMVVGRCEGGGWMEMSDMVEVVARGVWCCVGALVDNQCWPVVRVAL